MISVIIPTYNEEDVLKSCLESLGSQTFTNFEIIIVDDGSSDNTPNLLTNASKSGLIKYYSQDHKGAGAARNLGAGHAKGEILVFVDADMTFDNDFLKKLAAPIIRGGVKGTWSREEYVSNWENVWARCWNINEGWENKKRHPKNYPDTQPVFRAISKSEFDRVGGYNPGGYADDWSLYTKLGYKAINAPGAIFYHKNPSSLLEVYKHAKWVGKRPYKFGSLGYIVALLRSSLPISILIGIYKALVNFNLQFIFFKIVYDFGIFIGILEYVFLKKGSK